jgi:hypothetical protein
MSHRICILGLTVTTLLGSAALLGANDAPLGNDLKATIALQGMPCDQIVSSKRNADSDYTATCKDGNRYHVFVNPKGRVVVEKL